ncbi:MAG: hypothetical protein U9Q82_09265 [Chloroflexota bacterium]|nr:hypothetical protein [Chloroflexota bacterium]
MIKNVLLILLFIHVIAAIIYTNFVLIGRSYLRREYIFLLIFVPVFGPLAGLFIELINKFDKQGVKPVDVPSFTLGEEIYWKTIKGEQEDNNIVPLEEAILINDVRTRRKLMIETLYDDPIKYLDIMLVAKYNDDVETAHYATTTISNAQRKFQIGIQKYAVATENHPDNLELLDKYIELLEKYIQSGLLEDYLLKRQRIVYSKVLDKKLEQAPNDKQTLIRKLRNHVELGEYASAYEITNILKFNWTTDERVWIETLRVCVEGQDKERFDETIEVMKSANIDWTDIGRDEVSLWLGEQSA